MRGNHFFLTDWKRKASVWGKLLLPDRMLKFFPPSFIVRDPVHALLDKLYRQGESCAILLVHWNNYAWIASSLSKHELSDFRSRAKLAVKQACVQHLEASNLVALQQYCEENICVFVRVGKHLSLQQLRERAEAIRAELEQSLEYRSGMPAYVQTGLHLLDAEQVNRRSAAMDAYRNAHALATKTITPFMLEARRELKRIVQGEDISVLAQPIMNLHNGDVFGWEILTRGPEGSIYHSPVELFHFAYQADVLSSLEFLVVKKGLLEIAKRRIQEQVFINISPITLSHPLMLTYMLEQLRQWPEVRPNQLIFEITERQSIQNFGHLTRVIQTFREHGFRFAVDDAGAGYSSLQSIAELIPDIIKIDRSVIANIDQISAKQSMLQAILFFAEHVNCQVVAEGVEREEEADVLFRNNVHMGQGFYFARPEPFRPEGDAEKFAELKKKILLKTQKGSALA
ncbi:EAL domain-containing protein [Xylanibacillus composti]|uniref:EAL domain-containing protein n=1 Tax=Xylanibacillus composti TaxID=1572762 RepID=A0A8J4M3Q0_9BACL|nr:EAL domain-containing protein [Xylanibacillus composti]MDT9724706.1 EAL domain-containing protein [Xylanibacillus composti]GIQ70312.1 hypothetical protein XYCOK13_31360 [Xylanibacillus composti]